VAQVEHPGSQGIGVSLPLFIAKDFLQAGCAFRGLSQVANEGGVGGCACVSASEEFIYRSRIAFRSDNSQHATGNSSAWRETLALRATYSIFSVAGVGSNASEGSTWTL